MGMLCHVRNLPLRISPTAFSHGNLRQGPSILSRDCQRLFSKMAQASPCVPKHTAQWDMSSSQGVKYQIMISYPLQWKFEKEGDFSGKKANVIYVGIGYQMKDTIWVWDEQRRSMRRRFGDT